MEWNHLLSLERPVEKESEPTEFERYPISELEKDSRELLEDLKARID